jgi:hypothetical protein
MILQAHKEFRQRYQQKANDYNFAAALLAGAKFTPEGESIDSSQYLPYRLSGSRLLPGEIQDILHRLITEEKLPPAMVADLYIQKLLPPP